MAQSRKNAKRTAATKTASAKTKAKTKAKTAAKTTAKTTKTPTTAKTAKRATGREEHPTVALVRGLAKVVQSTALTELIVDTPDMTLTLRRGADVPVAVQAVAPAPAVVAVPAPAPAPAAPAPAPAPAAPAPVEDDAFTVKSPFVGTFYRRPNPDTEPYVEVGARVEKGQVLCIVEAMKLMNEIESDVSGTLLEVLIEDSEAVEYGQPLFRIKT